MIVPRAKTIDIDRRNRITSEPSTRIRNTWKIPLFFWPFLKCEVYGHKPIFSLTHIQFNPKPEKTRT